MSALKEYRNNQKSTHNQWIIEFLPCIKKYIDEISLIHPMQQDEKEDLMHLAVLKGLEWNSKERFGIEIKNFLLQEMIKKVDQEKAQELYQSLGEMIDHDIWLDLSEEKKENILMFLEQSIESLDEKEKMVLSLYFEQNLTLKEIGLILEQTESRACQIKGKAIRYLKKKVHEKLSSWNEVLA